MERQVYGLYITSAPSAAGYVRGDANNKRILFNVDFNGTMHLFRGQVGVFDNITITAFVVLETDDGREFDPALGDLATVILEGTSTLP